MRLHQWATACVNPTSWKSDPQRSPLTFLSALTGPCRYDWIMDEKRRAAGPVVGKENRHG